MDKLRSEILAEQAATIKNHEMTITRLRGLCQEALSHLEGRPMSMRVYTPERLKEQLTVALRETLNAP